MCNLSEGVELRGYKRGIREVSGRGIRKRRVLPLSLHSRGEEIEDFLAFIPTTLTSPPSSVTSAPKARIQSMVALTS